MTVADIFETMGYGPAPESAAEAKAWLDAHGRDFGLFIGGDWVKTPESFETLNPADGTVLAKIAQAGEIDVDQAVEAARCALAPWQALGGHGRAKVLYALARLLQKHARLFAVLETLDNGKPIRETRDIDIPLAIRHFYHHAGWAELLEGEFPGETAVGVVGQIVPWNFPLLMLAWKLAPALAAGCTSVLKPAEQTPLTALAFAELCREAGLPKGVVNIVTGDGRTGALIARHPGIDKIAFTGSTEVGREIRRATAGSGKKLSLELGGKSAFIVFDDADLDGAVEGVVDGIWFNQGQVCCAGSRLLMHEPIAKIFIEKLKRRMATLTVGDPLGKGTDIGAIVSPVQLARIERLVVQGVSEGACLFQPRTEKPGKGSFHLPTLLTDVAPASTVAQEEIFGPVLVAMTFRTPEEAIELANNTPYGLAASVWSETLPVALDIAPKLKAGTVWINSTNLFDASCGFGGCRESGYGREGGREGMHEYLRPAVKASAVPTPVQAPVAGLSGLPFVNDGARIDRTAKLYIGGKQTRPDGGYSLGIKDAFGEIVAEVPAGNRKDIRNAVEAARASAWGKANSHGRAQVLFYCAENLAARRDEFVARIAEVRPMGAEEEVDAAIRRMFYYASWADKFEGVVHQPPLRGTTLAINEPIGVLGVVCPDDNPLLGFVSLVFPALALGNSVVAVPSEAYPLSVTDLYQVFDTSDLPAGALNIVTGRRADLVKTLAEHSDVDALWHFADREGAAAAEAQSAANLKRVWSQPDPRNWLDPAQGQGRLFLRNAAQVKNIWVPAWA